MQKALVTSMISLTNTNLSIAKELVYERMSTTIEVEDYPLGGTEPFKEDNMKDLVGDVLIPTLSCIRKATNRNGIKLRRERAMISPDNESGGLGEYVVVDIVEDESSSTEKVLIVIEVKQESLGKGMIQCVLAMKDCQDANGDGQKIYGFLTTGVYWQMLVCDKGFFSMSEEFRTAFPSMAKDKERWMRDCSLVVDVLFSIL